MSETGPSLYVPAAKPVEAMRWTGDNWPAVSEWVYGRVLADGDEDYDSPDFPVLRDDGGNLSVLEDGNEELAMADDWLIKDADGNWHVGDSTFEDTYSRVPLSGGQDGARG